MKITFIGVWMAADVGETVSFVIDCDSGERILVDCGTNLVKGLLDAQIDPSSITHIIVTHTHGDHISGLPSYLFYRLMYAPGIYKKEIKPLEIISSNSSINLLKDYINIPYEILTNHPSISYTCCSTEDDISIGEVTFSFFESNHTPLTYGFSCKNIDKTFVYSADTALDEKIIDLAMNADFLIHDVAATHEYTFLSNGHTLCNQISPLLEKKKIKCLIPVHRLSIYEDNISPYIKELKNDYSGKIIVPTDGTIINI